MDPLSAIVTLLRPHAVFSKPITGRGDWGVRYDAYESPSFCIVLEGTCWLTLENAEPLLLRTGDFLLLSATPSFTLSSHPEVECKQGHPSATAVHHGATDGAPDFRMFGGAFRIEPVNLNLLFEFLPKMIHIRAAECDTARLAHLLELVKEECFATERPGREAMLERLMEATLIEVLRWHPSEQEMPSGLLNGLRDPAIALSLRAMHSDVSHGWTVAELAAHACLSRSSFAGRFTETLGCAPMEYLSRWRMSLAKDALSRGKVSLEQLAQEIGYESASAFSTAFRRRVGCAPGGFARAAQR